MTINSPAAVIFAMYVAVAEKNGVERARLGGTLQNDILKEYHAQKEFVFPPRAVDAAGARHDRVLHRRDAAVASDLDLRLPHPRGGLDGRAGARVHAGRRLRLRRARRWRPGSTSTSSRRGCSFFFNAHIDFFEEIAKYRAARRIWARWMRDRYGATSRAFAAAAVPHADRRRVAHRAAARDQHRPHRDRGARRRARRHAVAAHQLDGRGARAADREGGAHRAAHAAGHRPRDRCRQRRRPARRLVVRRGADRRDRAAGRGDLRPPRRARRRLDARRRVRRHRQRLLPGRDRRRGLRVRAQGQHAATASSSASTGSPRATTTTTSTSCRSPPSRSSSRSSGCKRCKADRDSDAVDACARPSCAPRPPTRSATSCRR